MSTTCSGSRPSAPSSSWWWNSWDDAHCRCCLARGSLVSTPQQVMEFTQNSIRQHQQQQHRNNNDHHSNPILWNLPESRSVIEWKYRLTNPKNNPTTNDEQSSAMMQQVTSKLQSKEAAATTTAAISPQSTPEPAAKTASTATPSSILATPTKALWQATTTILSPLVPWFREDDHADWVHQDDDAANGKDYDRNFDDDQLFQQSDEDSNNYDDDAIRGSSNNHPGWNQPVLCESLTRACVVCARDALAELVRDESSSSTTSSSSCFPLVVPRRSPQHHMSSSRSCWSELVQHRVAKNGHQASTATTEQQRDAAALLSQLSLDQLDFLLQCMVNLGGQPPMRLIPAATTPGGVPQEDLVVIGQLPCLQSNQEEEEKLAHQVVASWWELSCAHTALEQQRREWTLQGQRYAEQAARQPAANTSSTKNSQTRKRLLQLHRLVQQRLTDSEASIWNLEKAQHALEESVTHRQVVQALQTSTLAFQALRKSVGSVENVEDLLQSCREDVEDNEDFHECLTSVIPDDVVHETTEEELLQELQGLMLKDDNPKPAEVEIQLPKAPAKALPPLRMEPAPSSKVAKAQPMPG